MIVRGRAITAIKREQRKKKFKRQGTALGLVFLNVLIYAGVVALVLHLPVFRITTTRVYGVAGERAALVFEKAAVLLQEKTWYIFPRYTMITSPQTMAANVQRAFPWIESAHGDVDSSHTLRLTIAERTPAYLVCTNSCYYTDRTTLIFSSAPEFSAPVYPELRAPSLASSTPLMSRVFSLEQATFIEELIQTLAEQNLTIRRFEETAEGSYRAYMKEGWYVLMSREGTVAEIARSLRATMASARFVKQYAQGAHALAYIDVRLGDKVFYKFASTVSTPVSNATSTRIHN